MRIADCGMSVGASLGERPFPSIPHSEFRIPHWGGVMARDAYICAALRTPVGKHGGALARVRADDLAAIPIRAVVERTGVDPLTIDDVIFGCANQAGEDHRHVALTGLDRLRRARHGR